MALNFNAIQRAAAFAPATAFPLDARSYFESYDLAVAAAATAAEPGTDAASNTVYYFGETLVVNEGGKATLYIIQPNGTLKEVGAVPVGDGKSIEVVNGQIKLKGFGSGYYQYNTNYVPGSTEEGKKDQYIFVEEGFKAGLQPQVVAKASGEGFEIAWYEPNPTTVEGLQAQITALDGSVNNLANKVDTKADASSLPLYQTRALPSISGYASGQLSVEGALAEVMSKAMSNAGGITAVERRVATAENAIRTNEDHIVRIGDEIRALNAVSGTYATKTEVNALSSVYETIANVNSKLANYYTKEQADEKHEEVVEIAQGKTQTFVVNYADNAFLNSQDAELNVQQFTTIDGKTIWEGNIKPGDVILVVETDVPDRWVKQVNEGDFVLAKLETTKVDLEPYATISALSALQSQHDAEIGSLRIKTDSISGRASTLEGKVSTIEGWAASTISAADITKWNAAEENAHNSAVASASAMVAEEASIRASADNALSARIDDEESARIDGDKALSDRIDVIQNDYAKGSYVDDEISKLDAAIKAETSRATGAEASLATRLELVEDSLGLGGEGDHGGVAEQIATIIGEVWGANASASDLAEASSRIDDHEGRIGAIEDKVTNTLATKEYVKEQIQSAEHVISVKTDDTDFFEITKDQDDIVTINVKDDIENIIADAVTSLVSGGQYVSATISNHGLTIDDSNLVSAISSIDDRVVALESNAVLSVSEGNGISVHKEGNSLRLEVLPHQLVGGLSYYFLQASDFASNATYLLASEGLVSKTIELAQNLTVSADAINTAASYIDTLNAEHSAASVATAVTWVVSNWGVVSNLASNAVTSVQTSTLVMSHSGNNLIIDLPSVIWLDGGTASDTYEAEEAVYNELLNNEYGN